VMRVHRDFLILPIVLVVTLGIIELGLRRFMPIDYRPPASELPNVARDIIYQASDIPDLDYELVPSIETVAHGVMVRINSYGMRDDEPDPHRRKRIVVLGDSFTFGFRIPQEKVYPYLLEQALQANDQDYEVLNLAVSGYAINDEVSTLKHKGMTWEPEVIIIGYVMNDPEVEPIQQIPAYFREPSWWQYSHVLRLFARGKKRIDIMLKGGGDYYKYLHADPKSWTSVVSGFDSIRTIADGHDAKVMVVLFPDLWHAWDDYPYLEIHEQVRDLARDNEFEVIDLLAPFSAYSPDELRVSASDGHPNELAHRLTAQAILEALSK
jgi:hypothetical protein